MDYEFDVIDTPTDIPYETVDTEWSGWFILYLMHRIPS